MTTRALIILCGLVSAVSSQNCLRPLHFVGCQQDSECASFNGYNLVCRLANASIDGQAVPKQCLCPLGQDCTKSAQSGKAAQYDDCSVNPCIDSFGQLSGNMCAEKLMCVAETIKQDELPSKRCHTCSSCKESSKKNDCSQICSGKLDSQTSAPTTTPDGSTVPPSSTTDVPSITTDIPSSTTDIPSTTTDIPSTTTDIPSTTTEAPSSTSKAPKATKAPIDSKKKEGDQSSATAATLAQATLFGVITFIAFL